MLISLLPFILANLIDPFQIIIIVLLLSQEKQGPLKAIAFGGGMTLARLVQGLLFEFIVTGGSGDPGDSAEGAVWVKSTLLLILGILLLVSVFRKWNKGPDPDAPPPKWLAALENTSWASTFLLGVGIVFISPKLWVFTLGALSAINAEQLAIPDAINAFLWYVLLAQSTLIILILIRLFFPKRTARMLESFGAWLKQYNDQIAIVVSLIFGLLFLYQGVTAFF